MITKVNGEVKLMVMKCSKNELMKQDGSRWTVENKFVMKVCLILVIAT
jgi:hypothetical protein